ncbi:MAG: tetratricopeptide repeat protein [bacterium]|nr:tetratricopeptide repeat protein [bacterium]
MYEKELEDLKNIGQTIKRVGSKIKLLVLLEKAKKEYDETQFAECKNTCLNALENNPDNPVALRGLGCVEMSLGNYKNAISYFEKALKNSAKKEIEYTLIGSVYYLEDNFDKAIEYYNKAIDVNDNYDEAHDWKNQSILERHLKIADLQDNLIKRHLF